MYLSYNLQYFASEGKGGEKTEEPTSKRLKDARMEGRVAVSKEFTTSLQLIIMFLAMRTVAGFFTGNFVDSFSKIYKNISKVANDGLTAPMTQALMNDSISTVLKTCLPILLVIFVLSFAITLYQVKWKISGRLLRPKLSRLNPANGFKRFFSKDKLKELVVEVIKIAVILYIAYDKLKDEWGTLLTLYDLDLWQGVLLTGNLVISLGLKVSIIFLAIGIFDLFYQKIKFKKDMKMTKQEVKDEYKQSEGDPQVKRRIRAKMLEVSRRRMMHALPQADVVITNPTHLAAAIKYDKETSEAPVLIAKGADYLAIKIKEVAREHHIVIVENKPLARMLYYNVEIGQEIPPELYQMTAEVLAYVYGLNNKL